jgi:hypothetical protein
MTKEYKYTLETGSRKHHCPGCTKKTLVKYVFVGTKDYVGDEFGRCDRENNCGYHRPPGSDTPTPPHPLTKEKLPPPTVIFPDAEYLESIRKNRSTDFHRFCREKLGISDAHLEKWGVGGRWKFTAFILSDVKQGRAVNVKFVAYTPEGKRDKSEGTQGAPKYIPHYLGKSYLRNQKIETDNARLEDWQDYYKFGRCFYGEHLWDPAKDTCLVESEKTAVIAAFFFPGVNWLATGGNNGMTFGQFSIFNGYRRRIWNLVDNDIAGYKKSKTIQWLDKLAEMRDNSDDILSVNLQEGKPKGWDLADRIIFDHYKDEKRFLQDLNQAIDCRKKVEIDEESGEVRIVGRFNEIKPDPKELRRAKQVGDRIFESKVNLILDPDTNSLDLMRSIAHFGEDGRSIAVKVYEAAGLATDSVDAFFDLALLDRDQSPKVFFEKAKAAGVETRYIKTARSEAAEGAEGIDGHDWHITWPDDLEEQEDFDEFKYREQVFAYSYLEHKNCVWFAIFENSKRQIGFFRISNFVIRPLYLIKSKTDPKRLFEVKNIHGTKYILDIPAKALVSMTEFQVFCESQGNFLFEGSKQQFTKIKRKLYDQTRDAEEVKILGWQDEGFYAFANGIYADKFTKVDDHGIIKHLIEKGENEAEEKYFFIPAMSNIYKDEKDQYDLEKKFVYVKRSDVKFADWSQLFHETYGDNGVIGMAFYISSLFRDLIYSRFKFFPHLFHFGPPGTGKSTMCWSIQYMFGLERKPFMLNAGTAVGFHRTFAQFRNAVVWFDEYHNGLDFKRVQDLKSAYDGAGHVKGEWSASGGNSNRTTTTPVEAACNISGQELPIADNALFKRCILMQYHQTIFSDQDKERLTRLQKLQEKGLSHITGALTRFRAKMEAEYFKTFDEVEREIFEAMGNDPTIESRIIKNMAVIATTFKVLKDELPWPYNWPKMLLVMKMNIKSQNNLISNAKETSQFWDQVEYCINENELKDMEDFKVEFMNTIRVTVDRKPVEKNLGSFTKILFIRIATAHPKYMEALRKQGEKKGMDKGSLAHYLSNSPGFIGMVSSTRFKIGDKSFTSSAYAFEYKHLEDQGYNFEQEDKETPTETAGVPVATNPADKMPKYKDIDLNGEPADF